MTPWLFLFLSLGCFWGESCLELLPCFIGRISSVRCKFNDLERLQTGKIVIYHIQLCSELFFFGNKFHNLIGFDPGTSLVCAWRMPESDQLSKYFK